jgi:hypothetical protein
MSNHADSEEAVAATLNTPQGKGKQVADHGEGTSSRFKKKKKKKKNDKRRRDDNFVAVVERKASRPKGNVREFRKTCHPRNVEVYEIREMSFQEQRTHEDLES